MECDTVVSLFHRLDDLEKEEREEIFRHLKGCRDCRADFAMAGFQKDHASLAGKTIEQFLRQQNEIRQTATGSGNSQQAVMVQGSPEKVIVIGNINLSKESMIIAFVKAALKFGSWKAGAISLALALVLAIDFLAVWEYRPDLLRPFLGEGDLPTIKNEPNEGKPDPDSALLVPLSSDKMSEYREIVDQVIFGFAELLDSPNTIGKEVEEKEIPALLAQTRGKHRFLVLVGCSVQSHALLGNKTGYSLTLECRVYEVKTGHYLFGDRVTETEELFMPGDEVSSRKQAERLSKKWHRIFLEKGGKR